MKLKVSVSDVAAPAEEEVKTAVSKVDEPFRDRVPSNWEITGSAERIVARNNVTTEVFEGTIAEFNRKLRG